MTNANDTVHPINDPKPSPDGSFAIPYQEGGLTKRELFAAMAMQGMLANRNLISREDLNYPLVSRGTSIELIVKSVEAADALITQLNKEKA